MSNSLPLFLIGGGVGLEAFAVYQSGVAASAEAKAQASISEYNARVAEQQALQTERATQFQQQRQAEEAQRYESTIQANLGTSGAVTDQGTPLMIQAKQQAESELDNLMLGYQGQVEAGRARSQAAGERMQASIYKQKAGSSYTAGLIGAGSSLLTGFGKMASTYKSTPTKITDANRTGKQYSASGGYSYSTFSKGNR
jgi:hypothetical protein